MLYIVLLYLATAHGLPIQNQVGTHPLYYFPQHQQQYVRTGYVPAYYPQYAVNPTQKNIHSSSQNELLYYPTIPGIPANQVLVSPEVNHGITPANTQRFTAPPQGLVNAIFAWFAENNIAVPDGPSKNEILSDQPDKDKIENLEKPTQTTEVEVDLLADTEKSPEKINVKKTTTVNPGQRFYVLNGQPQFFSAYHQPLISQYPQQSFVPQVALRNAVPDDQNLVYFQPQSELQQANLKLKNSGVGIQNQEVYTPQNLVLLKSIPEQNPNSEKDDVRPIRYHGSELTKKISQQQLRQPLIENFPQQVFFERLLPQGQDIRTPSQLQTLYQTQYVPIGVVPPQEGNIQQYAIRNQEVPQEYNVNQHQPLQFIHIPVNKNVQLPQYIKTVVPISVDQNSKVENENQKENENNNNQISSRFAQTEINQSDKQSDDEKPDPNSEIPSLDFVRYLENNRNNDQFSDTVVIDAKTDNNEKKEEENNNNNTNNDEEVVQADEPSEPTIAQAQPAGIALAGPGGVASTAPRGTALAGVKGLAVSSPRATAVAGPKTDNDNKPAKKS